MRIRAKTKQLDALLSEIIEEDTKQRARSRRIIPPEVVEAMDYFVLWNRARTRGEALIQLAQPFSLEVIEKVRSIDLQNATNRVRAGRSERSKP
jgi:hypothetical protein